MPRWRRYWWRWVQYHYRRVFLSFFFFFAFPLTGALAKPSPSPYCKTRRLYTSWTQEDHNAMYHQRRSKFRDQLCSLIIRFTLRAVTYKTACRFRLTYWDISLFSISGLPTWRVQIVKNACNWPRQLRMRSTSRRRELRQILQSFLVHRARSGLIFWPPKRSTQ